MLVKWAYINSNQDIAYKIIRIHNVDSTLKAEMTANSGAPAYELLTKLTFITDAAKVHELETERIHINFKQLPSKLRFQLL